MNYNKRRRYLIDRSSQFRIAGALLSFWFIGILLVIALPLTVMFSYGTLIAMQPFDVVMSQVFDMLWFPMLMSLLLVPPGVWYSIRFSNRIAGPLWRLQREMKSLVAGEKNSAVRFRQGDFFCELAVNYNALRSKIIDLEKQLEEARSALATREGSTKSEMTGGNGNAKLAAGNGFPAMSSSDPSATPGVGNSST